MQRIFCVNTFKNTEEQKSTLKIEMDVERYCQKIKYNSEMEGF